MLLAWFLLGWTVRALVLRVAGYLGNIGDLWGQLVLPLAIVAQLATFVAMYLAIRRELPHLGRADAARPDEVAPSPARAWSETLLASILPFFLLYVAWNLIRDDWVDYYLSTTTQDNFLDDPTGPDVSVNVVTVSLVVIAFLLRWLAARFSDRLPRWTRALGIYLEAVWVLIALLVIRDLLTGLGGWLATRRMFGWGVDAWAQLRETFAWLATVGDLIGWVFGQIGTLIGLPLAWLALASIIYFGTMPRSVRPGPGAVSTASARWSRMPEWVQRGGTLLSGGILDRWRPVGLAARLIWRSGPIAIGGYLLSFAVLTASSEWLRMLVYRLVGPHEVNWWYGASDAIGLGISAIVGVVQVCLVAATFDYALRGDAATRLVEDAGDVINEAAEPSAERRTN